MFKTLEKTTGSMDQAVPPTNEFKYEDIAKNKTMSGWALYGTLHTLYHKNN